MVSDMTKSSKSVLLLLAAAMLTIAQAPPPAGQPVLDATAIALANARLADNAAGRWASAAASVTATTPLLDVLVNWDRLRREGNPATLADYQAFLAAWPGWPQEAVIRRNAERSISDATPMPARLAWFGRWPASTAMGSFRQAEALLVSGQPQAAALAARTAWGLTGLEPAAEAWLFDRFAASFTPIDHLTRMDRLLWADQTSAAGRMLPRVDVDHRLWALARIALRRDAPDVAARLGVVPAALAAEPGLLHDRAQWLKRKGRLAEAQALLADTPVAPGSVTQPERWLLLRLEFGRAAFRAGDAGLARRILAGHGLVTGLAGLDGRPLPERLALMDTEFLAGWLALRRLADPADAARHFAIHRATAITPVSQARGDYWQGRAAEAAGNIAAAGRFYAAAAVHSDYFHGQLAAEKLARPWGLQRSAPPVLAPAQITGFRGSSLVQAAATLGAIGDHARQTIFLRFLADRAQSLTDQALVAGLAPWLGRLDAGVYAGKAARSTFELALVDAAFPQLALPADLAGSSTIIHAIARQESQFDAQARSPSGALGLMQLLPGTAAEQAGKQGLLFDQSRLTLDPVYNVTLGAGYVRRLQASFAGSWPLAVAAYNAGPGNARRIIAQAGDPRDPATDPIDWVETLPIAETRTYVQRVLENAVVYDLLRPDTALSQGMGRLSWYLNSGRRQAATVAPAPLPPP